LTAYTFQCKCHAPDTRIDKKALDSFISASARAPFTARIVVDTGDGWGPDAIRTLTGLEPECQVLRFGDHQEDDALRNPCQHLVAKALRCQTSRAK
jgi:predicted helicase